MSDNFNSENLAQVLKGVLEQTVFIFTEPPEEEMSWPPQVCEAVLRFANGKKGRLALLAPTPFCIQLAANFLGVDPDDENIENSAKDALGELLNIYAGVVFAEVLGREATYMLDSPMVRILPAEEIPSLYANAASTSTLIAEEQFRIEVAIFFDEGANAAH